MVDFFIEPALELFECRTGEHFDEARPNAVGTHRSVVHRLQGRRSLILVVWKLLNGCRQETAKEILERKRNLCS